MPPKHLLKTVVGAGAGYGGMSLYRAKLGVFVGIRSSKSRPFEERIDLGRIFPVSRIKSTHHPRSRVGNLCGMFCSEGGRAFAFFQGVLCYCHPRLNMLRVQPQSPPPPLPPTFDLRFNSCNSPPGQQKTERFPVDLAHCNQPALLSHGPRRVLKLEALDDSNVRRGLRYTNKMLCLHEQYKISRRSRGMLFCIVRCVFFGRPSAAAAAVTA